MNNKGIVIGIAGNSTAGKNTLANILTSIFEKDGIESEQFALASFLKADINQFCQKHYGISAYTKDLNQKSIIRPLMVSHGLIKRRLSNGSYWCKLLEPLILDSVNEGNIVLITDVRYFGYKDTDEVPWLKNILNGYLIYVERYDRNGDLIPPANIEEQNNMPKLINEAHYKLSWQTSNDFHYLEDVVKVQLKELINKIKEKYKC